MNSAILTIDDIASKNTPAIVDYLKEKGITAVLFAIGNSVERYYDEAIYALKAGMIVGNHSHSHPAFSTLSYDKSIEEIEKCEAVLNKLYEDAGVVRTYRPFRFPYGDIGGDHAAALQTYFAEKGFHKLVDSQITYPWWSEYHFDTNIDTRWTFDFAEYRIRSNSGFTIDDVWKRMHDENPEEGAKLFGKDNRHIILLHAHDETEDLVPQYYKLFLDHVLENGMSFETPQFVSVKENIR